MKKPGKIHIRWSGYSWLVTAPPRSEAVYIPEAEAERLRKALEDLAEATSSAVNWAESAKEACGVAPWISQGDCNDVELALLKAREALGVEGDSAEPRNNIEKL